MRLSYWGLDSTKICDIGKMNSKALIYRLSPVALGLPIKQGTNRVLLWAAVPSSALGSATQ